MISWHVVKETAFLLWPQYNLFVYLCVCVGVCTHMPMCAVYFNVNV